eukprot:3137868-Pleurochrysis_carterae.AAC.3
MQRACATQMRYFGIVHVYGTAGLRCVAKGVTAVALYGGSGSVPVKLRLAVEVPMHKRARKALGSPEVDSPSIMDQQEPPSHGALEIFNYKNIWKSELASKRFEK